jgi:hypothetical protein
LIRFSRLRFQAFDCRAEIVRGFRDEATEITLAQFLRGSFEVRSTVLNV